MNSRPQKIWVAPKPTKMTTSWRVRWRVDGRESSRSFPTRAQADRFRRQLMGAVDAGERFDPDERLPLSWVGGGTSTTVASAAREYMVGQMEFAELQHGTIADYLDIFATTIQTLVRQGRRKSFVLGEDTLRNYIKWDLLTPDGVSSDLTAAERTAAEKWVLRNSLALSELNHTHAERLTTALGTHRGRGKDRKDAGRPLAASTRKHRVAVVRQWLHSCQEKGYMSRDNDPFRGTTINLKRPKVKVDPRRVLSASQAREFATTWSTIGETAYRYRIAVVLAFFAGLRFGELRGLKISDIHFPDEPGGWGWVRVHRQLTRGRDRRLSDGRSTVVSPLKSRAPGDSREIDLHPWVLLQVEAHLASYRAGAAEDELLITSTLGTSMPYAAWRSTWHQAVDAYIAVGGPEWLRGEKPHHTRHAAVSMWLSWGIDPARAAEWSGHRSLIEFFNTYAHVIDQNREVARGRVARVLDVWLDEPDLELRSEPEAGSGDPPPLSAAS